MSEEDAIREEVEDHLARLAVLTSPEETLAYVERLAERMREELGDG